MGTKKKNYWQKTLWPIGKKIFHYWQEILIVTAFGAMVYGVVLLCRNVEKNANYMIGEEDWYDAARYGWQWTVYGFQDQLGRNIIFGQKLKENEVLNKIFAGYNDCFEQHISIDLADNKFRISRTKFFQGPVWKIYWSLSYRKHAYAVMVKFSEDHYNLVVGACGDPQHIAELQESTLSLTEWSDEFRMWSKPSLIYLTKARSVNTIIYFYRPIPKGIKLVDVFTFDEHGSWIWNRAWIGLLERNKYFADKAHASDERVNNGGYPSDEDQLVRQYFGKGKMKELQRLREFGSFRNYDQIISW